MIEVEMSKDIRSFEPKFVGPFTLRQTIAITASCIYGIPFAIFFTPLELMDRILVAFMLMIPVMACGWLKLDGMHFEIYAIRFIYWYLLTPRKRKYVSQNSFREELKKINQKDELAEIEKMSAKDKKKYYKNKNKPTQIQYNASPEYKVYT